MAWNLVFVAASSTFLAFGAAALATIWIIPVVDAVVRWRTGRLLDQANALALETATIQWWLRLWCAALVAVPVGLATHGAGIVGVAAAFFVYVAPEHVLRMLIVRRRTLLRDQLVGAINGLANTTQAGLTLHQGLGEMAREVPNPLGRELRRIHADFERGRPLPEALEEVRRRLQLEPFTLFASAIQIALERGGRINEALARIAHSLRDHQRVERKMAADTSSGRREVVVLCLFPVVLGLLMRFMNPRDTDLLWRTQPGQVVLVGVAALVYFGGRWALRMMDLER